MRFRFEWFDELVSYYDYEVPDDFKIFDPVREVFGPGGWMPAPRYCDLGQYIVQGIDEEVTGENFLNLVQGGRGFLVLYDEHGFVLLEPPQDQELEEALPSNPPAWLRRIQGQLMTPRQTFWEKL